MGEGGIKSLRYPHVTHIYKYDVTITGSSENCLYLISTILLSSSTCDEFNVSLENEHLETVSSQ